MKAILVIDMPTECVQCPFHRIYVDGFLNETHCSLMAKKNKDGVNTRAEWCPLRPLPQKKNTGMYCDLYGFGWNDCLKKIAGETEWK